MTTLLENPLPILFFGIIAEAVLAAAFVSTRRAMLAAPMAAVLAIVLAGLAVERWVVTDREQVEAAIDGVIAALETNDIDKVLQFVAPDAAATRGRARIALLLVEITDAKIHNLEITVNRLTSPPSAEARFNGVVYYNGRSEQIPYSYYASPFTVELHEHGDRWLISNHVEHELRGIGGRGDRRD